MAAKFRLDVALVDRGLVESREKAQRLIMAGQIRLNGVPATKASQKVEQADVLLVSQPERFVSRGGWKLQAALDEFKVSPQNKVCLDLGASTGGFTDCLLQAGARKVFSVDVGTGQIAWKLRNDPRVQVLDGVNARYLVPSQLNEPAQFVTADVAFISVCKVLPAALKCIAEEADFVILIKPQFEAGRESIMKGGVVRDPLVHQQVIETVRQYVETEHHAVWQGVIQSPLEGPAGNKEFVAWFKIHKR